MSKPKILVLGSTGFIGSHLCQRLTKKNYQVISFSTQEFGPKNTEHYQGDIRNKKALLKMLKLYPGIIYLLTGVSGQVKTDKHPDLSYEINVEANINALDEIVKHLPLARVVFSSSRLEYGKPQYLPVDEKHPVVPISTYGIHKLLVTQYSLYLHQKFGLNISILRTSNPYGSINSKSDDSYNIVSQFIQRAFQDQDLIIYGSGKQKRDYLYIGDLIDLCERFITKKVPGGEIYNVGGGHGISLVEMAQRIIKIVGIGKIKYLPWPKNEKAVETGDYITDITKIKRAIGWLPKTDFDKGIFLSLQAYK